MRPSSRDMMLSAIKQRYPTFSQASAAYSTSLQPILLADLDKAYSEKSPTLSDLERMYGDGSSALWAKTATYNGLSFDDEGIDYEDPAFDDVIQSDKWKMKSKSFRIFLSFRY